MKQKIEGALIKIKFVERYKTISFNNQRECSGNNKTNKKEIIEAFKNEGYVDVKYFSKEKYFEVDKIVITEHLSIGLNFYTRFDEIDFILNIDCYNEAIPFNGPFGVVCQKLGNENFVKRPCFCSQDDFKRIISDCILLYEEFKTELM